ncbi:MAG: aminotransferase class V-fold PLP-dependent enzyme [Candidatus Latescibacteria bacterium]|nr:aminotransferase class V-fold PLP-dependent enzyme [Candidatus Latescibacterota bacterium]
MDIAAIRAQLPVTRECIYLNTGGIAPSLGVVTDSLVGEFQAIGQHGPPLIMDYQRYAERLEAARQHLAAFCGVEAVDLCLTHGVADGTTTVFNGIDWQAGDELILTDEEHPAVKIPAERLIAANGVKLHYLPIGGSEAQILQRLEALITPRTRLLALSHVTTDTGTRLPARAIVELAHQHGVPVLYDGAQSLGQFPVDVSQLGADFYSLLVYKWMYGPYTAGALYVEKSWQDRLRVVPSSANYFGSSGARRFEFAAVPPAYYHASAAATNYLQQLGIPQIEAQVNGLATKLRRDLEKAVPGLVIENPQDPGMCTGVVTFRVEGVEGPHISTELRARKIITRPTGLKFSGVRVSVSFFTTQEELDALIAAVGEIAAAKLRG